MSQLTVQITSERESKRLATRYGLSLPLTTTEESVESVTINLDFLDEFPAHTPYTKRLARLASRLRADQPVYSVRAQMSHLPFLCRVVWLDREAIAQAATSVKAKNIAAQTLLINLREDC